MIRSQRHSRLPRRLRDNRRGLVAFFALALAVSVAACGGGGGSIVPRPPSPLTITTTSVPDGVTNQAYSQTVAASGGTGARTWSVSAGSLPTGLSLNASTGAISGTPTATGTFNFTVQVQDSGTPQQSDTQALTIRIAAPLTITTASLPNGADNSPYNATVSATGGLGTLTWSISAGSLPTGLSLNSGTGAITGTPTVGGSFSFTVQVRDSSNPQLSDTQGFTVLILEVTTTGLPDGVENDAYSAGPFTFVGQVGAVTWSETTTSFSNTSGAGVVATPCEGLTLSFSAGTITGTPVNPGLCGPFSVRATDSDSPPRIDDQFLSIRIVADLLITTTSLPAGTTGTAYNRTVSATGGTSPFAWSEPTASFDDDTGQGAAGTSCEGLRVDLGATVNTSISGTPIKPGACAFTIRVDDSGAPAQFDEQSLSITVNAGTLVITTSSLPSGAVNRTYTATASASGGTLPFTWSEPTIPSLFDDVTGEGAPATPCEGLTLDFSTGTISGIPAVQGTCGPFTLQVNDSGAQTDSQTGLSILVEPEPAAAGRNDSIIDATPLNSGTFLASISPFTDPNNPAPDTDFYELTATAGATVTVEIFARRRIPPSKLDSVLEIVDTGGVRFPTGCRNEGNFDGLGLDLNPDGTLKPDPTPLAFDDPCINDDIELGFNRDSKLEFQVPAPGPVTFFVRVLDWRGDARPDFLYDITISGAN